MLKRIASTSSLTFIKRVKFIVKPILSTQQNVEE